MQNQIQEFQNEEFGKVEVLLIAGKPYFPATESAKILGYKNPHDAISRHCKGDGVVKHEGVSIATNQHGVSTNQTVEKAYISEGNLYRLIIRSKLPAAVRFESFVCDEILPSIRQCSAYITADTLEQMRDSREYTREFLDHLSAEHAKNGMLMDYVGKLQPKAQYYDAILQSTHAMSVSVIAKDYGMSAFAFNKLLHELGVQYKTGGTWLLYKEHVNKGYTISKTYLADGKKVFVHTCWTQAGRHFLYDLLAWYNIYPNVGAYDEAA